MLEVDVDSIPSMSPLMLKLKVSAILNRNHHVLRLAYDMSILFRSYLASSLPMSNVAFPFVSIRLKVWLDSSVSLYRSSAIALQSKVLLKRTHESV